MTMIFDGKNYAAQKEEILKEKVSTLKIKPKIVSILIGNDQASILYTNLKQKAAKRIGATFIIKKFPENSIPEKIISEIKKNNNNKTVHGIMVQLPLPKEISKFKSKILNAIAREKDVDGLTKNSPYLPATIKAVKEILGFATKDLSYFGKKAAVVGAKGVVGSGVVKMLTQGGYKVTECDKDTRDLYAKLTGVDLIVSAAGVPNLIKGEMIKEGVIAIDVASPIGDFDKGVYDRASFVTPVPGGVGPVTISCLLENLVDSVKI